MKRFLVALACVLTLSASLQAVISSSQKTVTTAATLLVTTGQYQPESVLLINRGSVSIYIGGTSGVTTSTGVEIKTDAGATIALKQNESLYAITASSTARVDVLESK